MPRKEHQLLAALNDDVRDFGDRLEARPDFRQEWPHVVRNYLALLCRSVQKPSVAIDSAETHQSFTKRHKHTVRFRTTLTIRPVKQTSQLDQI